VVARVICPDSSSTAANAVGPSSQGRVKTRWSLAHRYRYPSASATRAYVLSPASENPDPRSANGRCAPNSVASLPSCGSMSHVILPLT
jgi:hypothetical protein